MAYAGGAAAAHGAAGGRCRGSGGGGSWSAWDRRPCLAFVAHAPHEVIVLPLQALPVLEDALQLLLIRLDALLQVGACVRASVRAWAGMGGAGAG